jgi:leader peptidase (prepilin peptidase)/N-methyltransferase
MIGGMNLSLIARLPEILSVPWPIPYIIIGVFGAIIGSFLNVVIHRLPPPRTSIVFPDSRCPSCEAAIAFYDNIPVLSYLVLRGRCRSCQVPISIRYPIVELLTGLLFIAVTWRDGLTPALPFDLVFVSALMALIFIDAEHMLLLDVITYPGIVFALIARVSIPYLSATPHFDDLPSLSGGVLHGLPLWALSLLGAVIGGLIGGGSLWLMGWVWLRLRHKEAMGLGDVKMLFMVGAYLGWRLTILTIFLGALSGSVIGVGHMLYKGERDLQTELPFGVYLGTGTIVALLFGSRLVEWYLGHYR